MWQKPKQCCRSSWWALGGGKSQDCEEVPYMCLYIYNLPSELVGNANCSRLPTHQLPGLSIVSAISAEPLLLTCAVVADLPPTPHRGSEGVWISQVDLPNCMCLYRNSSVWWLTPPVSTLQEQRQHQKLEASLDTFLDIFFFQNNQKATTGHQHQRKPSSVFVCCQQAEVREIQLCWCWRQRKGFWAKETEKLLEVKKKAREVGFPPTIPALLMSWV